MPERARHLLPAAPARARPRAEMTRRALLTGTATAALVAAMAPPRHPRAAAEAPFSDGTWFADGSGWA